MTAHYLSGGGILHDANPITCDRHGETDQSPHGWHYCPCCANERAVLAGRDPHIRFGRYHSRDRHHCECPWPTEATS